MPLRTTALATLLLATAPAAAPGQSWFEVRDRQAAIADELATITTRVRALLEQMAASGGTDSELRLYRETADVLDSLGADEIQRILALLESAGPGGAAGRAAAIDAYGRQQSVAAQLQALRLEFERRERLSFFLAVFNELADRQTAAVRATANLARRAAATGSRPAAERRVLLGRDQVALADEAGRVTDILGRSADATPGEDGLRMRNARDLLARSNPSAAARAAGEDIVVDRWREALSRGHLARLEFRRAARALRPEPSLADAIRDAIASLRPIAAAQGDLAVFDAAASLATDRFLPGDRQADLLDATRLSALDTEPLSDDAAGHLRRAHEAMSAAVTSLDAGEPLARTRQEEARSAIEDAIRALQRQAEALAASPPPPPTPEQLADLARQAEQAARRQHDLNRSPDAQRQQQLSETTRQLRDAARSASVEAARTLQAAAAFQAAEDGRSAAATLEEAARQLSTAAAASTELERLERRQSTAIARLAEAAAAVQRAQSAATPELAQAPAPDRQAAAREPATATAVDNRDNSTPNPPGTPPPTAAPDPAAVAREVANARATLDDPATRPDALPAAARTPVAAARQALQQAAANTRNASIPLAEAERALRQARDALAAAALASPSPSAGTDANPEESRVDEALAEFQRSRAAPPEFTPRVMNQVLQNSGDADDGSARAGGILRPRDRDALRQARDEPVPPAYAPAVEDYLRAIAAGSP